MHLFVADLGKITADSTVFQCCTRPWKVTQTSPIPKSAEALESPSVEKPPSSGNGVPVQYAAWPQQLIHLSSVDRACGVYAFKNSPNS